MAFEGDRYQFFTGISYTYDGNVFRVPNSGVSPPKKDLIRNTYVGVGLNLPISRQQIVANVKFNQTRFRDLSELNYTGRAIDAAWYWQLGNDWSGTLGYSQSKTASDFSNVRGTTQNLRDQNRLFFDVGVMVDATHRLESGLSQSKSKNSTEALESNNYTDNQFYAGIRYISAANNYYGLRLSYDDFKLPNPTRFGPLSVDNSHEQATIDLLYSWKFNGVSKISGRVGYEGRQYNEFNDRDYTGLAWNVNYDWTPNDKSAVLFSLRREIDGLNDFAASYALTHAISVRPRWLVSSKLDVNWDLSYSRLEFRGDPGIVANQIDQARKDKLKTYGMSLDYRPLPSTNMSLSVRREQRSSNLSGIGFEDTIYGGSVDLKF